MRFTCLVTAAVAMLLTTTTTPAFATGGCQGTAMTCCKHEAGRPTACCKHDSEPTRDTVDVLFKMDRNAIRAIDADLLNGRETAVVWFERAVWVGDKVLMGKYIIEHDTDRQARGEPCTHIYPANDRTTPVVAFHCTHLNRDERVQKNTVVLQSLSDGTRKFVEFQFAATTRRMDIRRGDRSGKGDTGEPCLLLRSRLEVRDQCADNTADGRDGASWGGKLLTVGNSGKHHRFVKAFASRGAEPQ